MRSMLLVLALSAPSFALAARNDTTNLNKVPTTSTAKARLVPMSFFNSTLDKCRVRIGDASYAVASFQRIEVNVAVGSTVRIDSETNSKIVETLQTSAGDARRQVVIRQAR